MKEVIQKAIGGGFDFGGEFKNFGLGKPLLHDVNLEKWEVRTFTKELEIDTAQGYIHTYSLNDILLDPLFWRALGKAMGWTDWIVEGGKRRADPNSWKANWHRFIDHLAEGKDPKDFFKELLK